METERYAGIPVIDFSKAQKRISGSLVYLRLAIAGQLIDEIEFDEIERRCRGGDAVSLTDLLVRDSELSRHQSERWKHEREPGGLKGCGPAAFKRTRSAISRVGVRA
jgi:hypothetical protein